MSGINIDAMVREITSIMTAYASEAAEDVKAEAKKAAKEAVKELKQSSPKGAGSKKGHYKDGWTSKVVSQNSNTIEIKVYNKKKPGLTHLLEKGHAKRHGGRVEGIPHIAPVEEHINEEFERRVRRRLME